ncbi:hypothetical protein DL767_004354 [Monosporascus sp. MG133]|nr:hypothetical protein DL767_004354 [Monosporascus sp. MG133]
MLGQDRPRSSDGFHVVAALGWSRGEKSVEQLFKFQFSEHFREAWALMTVVGLKESEQKVLLEFLMQHMIMGHDFQARVSWTPRSILIFDNRCTLHTAVVDYVNDDDTVKLRHLFRLAAMAEKPIPVAQDGVLIYLSGLVRNMRFWVVMEMV